MNQKRQNFFFLIKFEYFILSLKYSFLIQTDERIDLNLI